MPPSAARQLFESYELQTRLADPAQRESSQRMFLGHAIVAYRQPTMRQLPGEDLPVSTLRQIALKMPMKAGDPSAEQRQADLDNLLAVYEQETFQSEDRDFYRRVALAGFIRENASDPGVLQRPRQETGQPAAHPLSGAERSSQDEQKFGIEPRTLEGHSSGVTSVAFSPDGKSLASASLDKTIKLWNPAAQKEIRSLVGHLDWVHCVSFSPDGRLLASGSDDKTARLWDAATGKELATLSGHRDEVLSVAFSPDGSILASAGDDNTVRLWDVATRNEIKTLSGHGKTVRSVAFSPSGRTLASSGDDNSIKIWNVETGKEIRSLSGHGGRVNAVVFRPDGKVLASASDDTTIRMWDVDSGDGIGTHSGHESDVRSLAFSPDGRMLASASSDHAVKLWDALAGDEIESLCGHGSRVRSVSFSPDGRLLASGGDDRTIKLWMSAAQPGFEVDQAGHRTAATPRIIEGDEVADATKGRPVMDLFDTLDAKSVTFLDWAGPGRVVGRRGTDLVALTQDGRAELWHRPLPSQEEGYIFADEQTILWNEGGERGLLIAVAATDGQQLYELEGERAIMIDGDRFLARNCDGTASLRRTESGKMIVSLPGLSEDMPYALSPDRRWLAAGYQPVQLWDLEGVSLRHSFGSDITARLEFTPDSTGLIVTTIMTPQSGMQDEVTQRTYDVRTGTLVDERSWWERQ